MDKISLLKEVPVIAIIRGVKPADAVAVAQEIYNSGIRAVEVPLNSPEPFTSIRLIVEALGEQMLVGAGTVLTEEDVVKVHESGGKLIVSPNVDSEVIRKTKSLGMVSYPGVMTVSESFDALKAGADGLKLFPANVVGKDFIKAAKVVLPEGTSLFAVGGVNADNIKEWLTAGADGFGLGSCIYKPDMSLVEIREKCDAIVTGIQ